MICPFEKADLPSILQIWLNGNLQAHSFIPGDYWTSHYEMVRAALPQAEIYVHKNSSQQIDGFIGLSGNYIEGLFVKANAQSQGIGKQLLTYAKSIKPALYLKVYEKNTRAIQFYLREQFIIQSENTERTTDQHEYTMVWRK